MMIKGLQPEKTKNPHKWRLGEAAGLPGAQIPTTPAVRAVHCAPSACFAKSQVDAVRTC